jgi:hypothetical protein
MMSLAEFQKVVTYDKETGIFYRKGNPTGRVATKGYMQVCVKGKRYMAQRLAWLFVYGEWPDGQIDHINRNKLDNRIANLRIVTNQQNQENVGLWAHNTTGYRGVSSRKNGTFQADIKVNKKTVYLGKFPTAEDAAIARMKAEKNFFSLLDYSPNYSSDDNLLKLLEVRLRPRAP